MGSPRIDRPRRGSRADVAMQDRHTIILAAVVSPVHE
jgi:hypothetical protein